MRKIEIRVEPASAFFERGRTLARAADRGIPIPSSRIVAFEEVESLLRILTAKRVLLLRQVGKTPGSISDLAKELGRDRSAVARDVQVLEHAGVLQVSEMPLPGHGRQRWVTPVAQDLKVTAQL